MRFLNSLAEKVSNKNMHPPPLAVMPRRKPSARGRLWLSREQRSLVKDDVTLQSRVRVAARTRLKSELVGRQSQ